MGAGHDGAARELARRLEARGATTRTVDFLDAAPRAGWVLRHVYGLQLKAAPWSYEATYRVWYLSPALCRPVISLLSALFARRLRLWARELRAHTIVSTYPLASVVLGHERARGRLGVPVVTFLTDFAVHPLWVHPAVDLHLCVHPQSAAQAAHATGTVSRAPGPLVPERFRSGLPDRHSARARLGLDPDHPVVLVVAGSWGVGELEHTFKALLNSGRYIPVAVCGRNSRLRRRLESLGGGMVIGWTDEMPTLMAAADVLVQNAGGLTCMEAFAAGLPVLTYRPIPGHGRQNAADMSSAGVAAFASDDDELIAGLDLIVSGAGEAMTGKANGMFKGDAAEDALALADGSEPLGAPARRPAIRRVAAAAVAMAVMYGGLNLAADAATAMGIGVARPSATSRAAYLGVRLGRSDLSNPLVAATLARDHVTAIVEGDLAATDPEGVRYLAAAGVDIANGGWGAASRFHLVQPEDGVLRASELISRASHRRCRSFAPEQGVNGIDLASAHFEHERIVRPSRQLTPTSMPEQVSPRHIYVIDAERSSPTTLLAALGRIEHRLSGEGTPVQPLIALR